MGWRTVIVSGRAKLDLKLNHMVVRKDDIHKIHIHEIQTLIIETTTVSITTALLAELSRSKVKVIFCDEKHNPFGELTSYYNKHNTSLMVKQQISWKESSKTKIWTEIVRDKIQKQAFVLRKFGRNEHNMLNKYASEIELGDVTNREGHAAKVYFNALFGMGFKRDDENPTNAALNYGYSILLSTFNQEVVSNGYITQLGIFHDNQFNQYNLSSDLMEPFRPIVDIMVANLKPTKFETEEKLSLLELGQKLIFIDNKECTIQNGISVYSKSLFEAMDKDDPLLIKRFAIPL